MQEPDARQKWAVQLRLLAATAEAYAPSVKPYDEACSVSMDFVALRLRRILVRLDESCEHCHDDPPVGHTCPACGSKA